MLLARADRSATGPAGRCRCGRRRQGRRCRAGVPCSRPHGGERQPRGQFAALNKAANQSNPRFDVDQVKNSANGFTARHLSRYNAVVFLNTTGDALDAGGAGGVRGLLPRRRRLRRHRLGDRDEPELAVPDRHPRHARVAAKLDAQTVTNKPADRVHDASKNLPEYWNLNDTYYNFAANVRGISHVLTTVVAAPFNKTGDGPTLNALTGSTMGADHPVTWCKDYQGGRSYYTNHGASAAAWNDANLAKELVGAIRWAAGQSDPVYSDCGATVLRELPAVVRRGAAEPERADRLRRPARRQRPRDPDRPPRRRPAPRPGHQLDARSLATDPASTSRQRGRDVRAGGRQQLQHEQVGVPLLLPARRSRT